MSAAAKLSRISGELEQRRREVLAAQAADLALRWFEQYGKGALPEISFELHSAFASKTGGANEAHGYIERAATRMAQTILNAAIDDAKSDLEKVLAEASNA